MKKVAPQGRARYNLNSILDTLNRVSNFAIYLGLKMIIAIDFDGTCVDHIYPNIGKEVPYAVATLKEMARVGHKLILWTMRSNEQLQQAVKWFSDNNIPLYSFLVNPTHHEWTTSRKCCSELYIDYAAFGCPLI